MSTLLKQAAGPRYDSSKYPCTFDSCPKCGGVKYKRNKQCQKCRCPRSPIDPIIYEDERGRYRRIPLTKRQYAIVDEDFYESLMQYSWSAFYCAGTRSFYAIRSLTQKHDGRRGTIQLQRQVMNAPCGMYVDHASSGDTLNNRRYNLRVCNSSQNMGNTRKHCNASSKYKGVAWYKKYQKWRVQICINRKARTVGYFVEEADAARAYNAKAVELFGEFARLNEID